VKLWWKRVARQRWFQVLLGTFAAEYLRFVFKTPNFAGLVNRVKPGEVRQLS